jgi:serine-type D-Ala-D-Ala carboxypeptidase/endopeptidase (penicillin-binding protein 4)
MWLAWRSPLMPEFVDSMPLAAVDGTMRKRLGNCPVAGPAHTKNGYLDGVRAIKAICDNRSQIHRVIM